MQSDLTSTQSPDQTIKSFQEQMFHMYRAVREPIARLCPGTRIILPSAHQ